MKRIHKIFTTISLALVLILGSCEKWIDPEYNTSPNSPSDVPINLLLPSASAALSYVYMGDYSRYASLWMQHLSGVDRQAYGFELYNQGESDDNNLWNTFYGATLKDLSKAREKAITLGAVHYIGVVNVMTAYTLSLITDAWDDAPFSKALVGETKLQSEYDTQETLFATINTLLDDAITELSKPAPTGVPAPTTTSDLIYKGNIPNWIAAAKSLKLRNALHLQKKTGNWNAVSSIITAGGLISSNTANFKFSFGTPSNESGPIYNFDTNRGDIRVGAFLVTLMNGNSDPRRPLYFSGAVTPNFTVPSTYVGSKPGAQLTSANWAGPAVAARNATAYFITYAEVKFIEAEWRLRTSTPGAANAFRDAITASLGQYGATAGTWVTTNYGALTDATITITDIIHAKYTHLYMQPEAWNDWKRTGLPVLEPAVGNVTAGVIPRRFIYPQDERLYNGANMPAGKTITDRVWWDVP